MLPGNRIIRERPITMREGRFHGAHRVHGGLHGQLPWRIVLPAFLVAKQQEPTQLLTPRRKQRVKQPIRLCSNGLWKALGSPHQSRSSVAALWKFAGFCKCCFMHCSRSLVCCMCLSIEFILIVSTFFYLKAIKIPRSVYFPLAFLPLGSWGLFPQCPHITRFIFLSEEAAAN